MLEGFWSESDPAQVSTSNASHMQVHPFDVCLSSSGYAAMPLPGCCPTPEAGLRLLHCVPSASGRHPTTDAALQETQKLGSRFRIVGDVLEDVVTVSGDLATLLSSDSVQCMDGSQDLKVEVDQEAEERLLTLETPSRQLFDCCVHNLRSSHSSVQVL